jgi:hypothetical protein
MSVGYSSLLTSFAILSLAALASPTPGKSTNVIPELQTPHLGIRMDTDFIIGQNWPPVFVLVVCINSSTLFLNSDA